MSKVITTRTFVRRRAWVEYGPSYRGTHRGSGYCEDYHDRQYLIKEWRLFGIRIWQTTLDWEEVPVWAWAQMACSGFCSWDSKFKEYIKN